MPARKTSGRAARPAAKASRKKPAKGAQRNRRPAGGSAVAPRDAPAGKDVGAGVRGETPPREVHGDARPAAPAGAPVRAAETMRREREAQRMHQDPRWAQPKLADKWLRAKRDPRKESGLAKERQVRRLQGFTNWFRQAPKPKG